MKMMCECVYVCIRAEVPQENLSIVDELRRRDSAEEKLHDISTWWCQAWVGSWNVLYKDFEA